MSGRMEIDTTRVGALARELSDAAHDLRTVSRPSTPGAADDPSTPWADALARHRAGVDAVAPLLSAVADRADAVADALVAAVGTTTAQDRSTAGRIDRAGDLR
ncbi:MAG: hypothetical protein PGN29_18380 [Gordonia paraffinivorans]